MLLQKPSLSFFFRSLPQGLISMVHLTDSLYALLTTNAGSPPLISHTVLLGPRKDNFASLGTTCTNTWLKQKKMEHLNIMPTPVLFTDIVHGDSYK